MSEPKKRNWVKYLLIVSLGLNLIVAGLMVGAKVSGHGPHKRVGMPGFGMRGFVQALPRDKRAELRAQFRDNRSKMRANGKAMHKSMDTIRAVIAMQPFDAEALHTAFTNQRAQVTSVTQDAQDAFVKIIADMSDAERAEFAENLNKQQLRHREKHKK